MCGIVGKYYFEKLAYYDGDLDRMLQTITHRGPDSDGRFSDGRILLGFRRLSIIDTVTGDQPLYNEDRQIAVISNGEIYNYKELKALLQAKGHTFQTASDCEVIVHLYEEYGSGFIDRLNGMFAFCLYDCRRERLLMARDRVGIKPLYYSMQNGVMVFASEIKAILKAHEVMPVENENVLEEYLCFRFLAGNRTFFKGVKILSPGFFLEASPDGFSIQEYWKPSIKNTLNSVPEAIRSISENLQESVQRQLMSDVPLGTQLSGGVDSSWVSILAARQAPGLKSFSVGFKEASFDETPQAKEVAALGGLEYHEITSDPRNFDSLLPRIIWHNDEPLAHANSLEIYNLCRYAKAHVKVLLTGEGADELFGGYPRYYLCKIAGLYNKLPVSFQMPLNRGLDFIFKKRGKKPSDFLGMNTRELVFWNPQFTNPQKIANLMDKGVLDLSERRSHADRIWDNRLDLLDNLLLYEFQSYLQPILLRQDKMSMGASIEARVPILDNEMVNLAFSIPAREKIKRLNPKVLFKRAAVRDLPSKIVYKRKVGFGIPVGLWMRKGGQLDGRLELLNEQRNSLPGVNAVKLERLIQQHRMGLSDHQDILWPLVNYVLWREIFFSRGGEKP